MLGGMLYKKRLIQFNKIGHGNQLRSQKTKDKENIGVKWVYMVKHNPNDSIQRSNARLVDKVYAQQHQFDYNKTFAPVARLDTIRTIIALVAQKGWNLYQLDLKNLKKIQWKIGRCKCV